MVWKLDGRTVPPGDEICSLNKEARAVRDSGRSNLVVLDGLLYLKENNSLGLPFSRPVAPREIRDVVF